MLKDLAHVSLCPGKLKGIEERCDADRNGQFDLVEIRKILEEHFALHVDHEAVREWLDAGLTDGQLYEREELLAAIAGRLIPAAHDLARLQRAIAPARALSGRMYRADLALELDRFAALVKTARRGVEKRLPWLANHLRWFHRERNAADQNLVAPSREESALMSRRGLGKGRAVDAAERAFALFQRRCNFDRRTANRVQDLSFLPGGGAPRKQGYEPQRFERSWHGDGRTEGGAQRTKRIGDFDEKEAVADGDEVFWI
jgi:hypothetical protein